MPRSKLASLVLIAGGLCAVAGGVRAQETGTPPHVPLAKTIGQVSAKDPVPSLFVVNSAGAKLEGNTLTMTGVAQNSIVFADRPVRAAGHVTTEQFIMQWDEGKDNFIKDPPNATISVLGGDGSKVEDAVVTLMKPKLSNGNLTFEVAVLEGSLSGGNGPAALFIDRGGAGGGGGRGGGGFGGGDRGGDFRGGYDGRGGFDGGDRDMRVDNYHANYWHAPDYHGAWYAGAGAVRPYYGYGSGYGQCGYYPYPPCY